MLVKIGKVKLTSVSGGINIELLKDLNGNEIVNANKNNLLTIAIHLFSLNGFSSVSIRDITRAAGIKESSFYNHFRSKEELQATIFFNFRRSIGRITPPIEHLDTIIEKLTPTDFLRQGYKNFIEHITTPKIEEIWRILYLEQCRNEFAREIYLNDVINHTVDFLEIVFSKYQMVKKIPPLSARMLAVEFQYPIYTMISEFILLRLDKKSTQDNEKKITDHIEFFSKIIEISEGDNQ